MLSKTELLFLKGELQVNPNYERVIACRIKKKIEKRINELASILPLLKMNEKLNDLMEKHYRKLVMLQENCNIEKTFNKAYFQKRSEKKEWAGGAAWNARRICNPKVAGSNPARSINFLFVLWTLTVRR